jgi:gluconolactonase
VAEFTESTPQLLELVSPDAALRELGSGFTFTEGPVWDPVGNVLIFSDMPADVRRQWSPENGTTEVMRPSNKCNGLAFDAQGRLLVCEHATSSLVRENPDGNREVLATHWGDKELNSPNDVLVLHDGSILFSDPGYGRWPGFGIEREQDLSFQGLYRIDPQSGELQLVADDFGQPNGLCMSPDESLLYVNDTDRAHIRVFDNNGDGTFGSSRVFRDAIGTGALDAGVVDGMKCDERGNVWVTGPGGVWVLDPSGGLLGVISIPENVGNLTFGGPDWSTLYIAASTQLWALDTLTRSATVPNMARA